MLKFRSYKFGYLWNFQQMSLRIKWTNFDTLEYVLWKTENNLEFRAKSVAVQYICKHTLQNWFKITKVMPTYHCESSISQQAEELCHNIVTALCLTLSQSFEKWEEWRCCALMLSYRRYWTLPQHCQNIDAILLERCNDVSICCRFEKMLF